MYTLVLTAVLSLPLGQGSSSGVLRAFPLALLMSGLALTWIWSNAVRSLALPAHEALDGAEGARVLLRRATSEDADSYLANADDVVVESNGLQPRHIRDVARTIRYGVGQQIVVTDKATDLVIGTVVVNAWNVTDRTCDVGWWLGPTHRGEGYGTDAARATFASLHAAGFHRVIVGTSPDNAPVHRILGSVGAHHTARRPHRLPNGQTITSDWYEVTPAPTEASLASRSDPKAESG